MNIKSIFIVVSFTLICFTFSSTAQQKVGSCPCCNSEYRQFDFWLGDWNAYKADGSLAGTNSIVLLQDSCILQENWISAGGKFSGTSYNFYNPTAKKWKQLWLDNQGGFLELEGTFRNGQMILISEVVADAKGKPVVNKITWTPNEDGTVRQLWEVTNDYGKTWSVFFDGLYKRK